MQLTAALRERDRDDRDRVELASIQPHRRGFTDPLDPRLESPLGRLRLRGKISEAEYRAGIKWHSVYWAYIGTIRDPDQFSDEHCDLAEKSQKRGREILEEQGKRVLHAVNAVAVFEEPEELGDFEVTLSAARKGLAALARAF